MMRDHVRRELDLIEAAAGSDACLYIARVDRAGRIHILTDGNRETTDALAARGRQAPMDALGSLMARLATLLARSSTGFGIDEAMDQVFRDVRISADFYYMRELVDTRIHPTPDDEGGERERG